MDPRRSVAVVVLAAVAALVVAAAAARAAPAGMPLALMVERLLAAGDHGDLPEAALDALDRVIENHVGAPADYIPPGTRESIDIIHQGLNRRYGGKEAGRSAGHPRRPCMLTETQARRMPPPPPPARADAVSSYTLYTPSTYQGASTPVLLSIHSAGTSPAISVRYESRRRGGAGNTAQRAAYAPAADRAGSQLLSLSRFRRCGPRWIGWLRRGPSWWHTRAASTASSTLARTAALQTRVCMLCTLCPPPPSRGWRRPGGDQARD